MGILLNVLHLLRLCFLFIFLLTLPRFLGQLDINCIVSCVYAVQFIPILCGFVSVSAVASLRLIANIGFFLTNGLFVLGCPWTSGFGRSSLTPRWIFYCRERCIVMACRCIQTNHGNVSCSWGRILHKAWELSRGWHQEWECHCSSLILECATILSCCFC